MTSLYIFSISKGTFLGNSGYDGVIIYSTT